MITITRTEALAALYVGQQKAIMMLAQAKTAARRDIAAFWVDYFARQIVRWEGKR